MQTITEAGKYYIEVENTLNGCKAQTLFEIKENFITPQLVEISPLNTLNCSRDTLALTGSTISLDSTLVWNGPNSISSLNSELITNQLGWHYLTVKRGDNGCTLTDSVNVVFQASIDVDAGNDTLICKSTA